MAGWLSVADVTTEAAHSAIAELKALDLEVAMVTGDRRSTASAIASELGITRIHAEVKPTGKAAVVEAERGRGRIVAMVGDGINDAPALAGAHVGVAIGTGADVAIAAADVALLRGRIGALPQALRLSRAMLRTIRQNLFWAFVYNVVGIPIAAGLLYPLTGWTLSPVLASAAMSLSSVSVLANSLRLRRFERAKPSQTLKTKRGVIELPGPRPSDETLTEGDTMKALKTLKLAADWSPDAGRGIPRQRGRQAAARRRNRRPERLPAEQGQRDATGACAAEIPAQGLLGLYEGSGVPDAGNPKDAANE